MTGSAWLDQLNAEGATAEVVEKLVACCAAESWVSAVVDGRPYPDEQQLFAVSDRATANLDDEGLAQALAAHPRIGERQPGAEAAWSRQEQAGMTAAAAGIREQMADANRRYEARFGQVYLVCATGLSAAELLAICLTRLGNDPQTERAVVLGELAGIARVRLAKLLGP